MHFKVNRSALARELALLSGVVEARTTIPILSNVLLSTDGHRLNLAAADLERAISCGVDAEVIEGGAITLPAKRLTEYVKACQAEEIAISVDDKNWATVKAGRSRSRMAGTSAESFPQSPESAVNSFTINARAFMRLLNRVRIAISKEESRFALGGALVEGRDGKLLVVATDSHRLAMAETVYHMDFRFLITTMAITAYAKLADSSAGASEVAISQDENNIYFVVGGRTLVSRKLSGNFPDYKRVLPNHTITATVDRGAFGAAIGRVAQFADEWSKAIRVSVSAEGIAISAAQADLGDASELIECEYSGDAPLEFGFNGTYLSDFLAAAESTKVQMLVKDGKSAVELRPMAGAGTEQDPYRATSDYRYILMPMRV